MACLRNTLYITKSRNLVRNYISFSDTMKYHHLPSILIIIGNHPLPSSKRHGALMNSKWVAHEVSLGHNRQDPLNLPQVVAHEQYTSFQGELLE